MILQRTDKITFDKEKHSYKTEDGIFLLPVSSVLDTVELPFRKQEIANRKATSEILKMMNETTIPVHDNSRYAFFCEAVEKRKNELIAEWDAIGEESMQFGNWVDINLTSMLRGEKCEERLSHIVEDLRKEHRFYAEEKDQFILFSKEFGICGMADWLSLRPGRNLPRILDIWDIKTGLNKGISFESSYWKDQRKFFKNEHLLPPVSHLENCTYNRYCLQLSAYGLLAELMLPVKIGRLGIIYVSRNDDMTFSYQKLPVPYLYMDVLELFKRIHKSQQMLGNIPFNA